MKKLITTLGLVFGICFLVFGNIILSGYIYEGLKECNKNPIFCEDGCIFKDDCGEGCLILSGDIQTKDEWNERYWWCK